MATSAPSPLASSVEKANGAKLSRLLIDGGTTILRKIFDHCHPRTNLVADLNANLSILNGLKGRRILNGHQWDKLFPPSGAAPDSNTFDITLLFLLLTSICGLSPPLFGWHMMPSSSDTSLEANLARIKAYRNELYGHVTSTGIPTALFKGKWKEISSVLVSLGLSQSEVDRLEAEPCVEDYVSAVTEWMKNDGEIKSQLKELHEQQEEILRVQEEQHSTQQTTQQDVKEILRTQQQAFEVMKEAHQDSSSKLEVLRQSQSQTRHVVHEVSESIHEVIKEEFENLKKRREMDWADDLLKNLVKSEFRGDVEFHAEKFQQGTREWIFKRVQDWLDDRSSPNRVMVISGNAGMGKTVISAVVSQRMQEAGRLLGSHFCQHNNPRYRNPQLMLQFLASHLSHSMAEYKHALAEQLSRNLGRNDLNNMGVEELFALLFKEPLSTLADPGRNTLIVIDGLDESESQGRNELLDVIGSQFCKLPLWIRLLVTTRPERNIAEKLRHLKPIELQKNQGENLKDIQILFEEQLSCNIGDENKTVLLKELVKKSEGLFLFAHFLIEFIRTKFPQLTLDQLKSALPRGISSVYLSYFERLEKELRNELKVDEEHVLRFLCAITASREPLPVEIISKILSPSGRTLTTQRRVNKAIACISALLPIRDGHLHFFHKSVKDWLSNATPYGQHDFTVDDKKGHEILFNLCTNELDNIKRKGVEETQFNNAERYALQHCVQHMLEAAEWDDELRTFSIKEELVNDYVTCAELISAKLCVNSTIASEDLLSVRKQVKQGMLNDQSYLVLDPWLHFLRKHSYMLRDHPHLFFQCLLNEGPELSSKSAKILESHLPNVPYMAYVDKEEHKGADQARFYCPDTIACFDVSRDMDYLVCECRDGTIHLWSLQTCNREWVRPSLTEREFIKDTLCFIEEDDLCYSAYRKVKNCLSFYRSVVFHWSGNSVLPGTLRQVYSLNGELNDLFPDSDCTFSNCAFTGDRKKILTDCPDERKKVFLWDMGNGKKLSCINWNEEICSFAISQDGSLIAITDLTGIVVLFDLKSSRSHEFSFDAVCSLIHFTSDNDTLACGFLRLTQEEVSTLCYRYVFYGKPVVFVYTPLKDVLLSADCCAPPLGFHFLLWPSVPRKLALSDFIEQDSHSCWVNKVHRVIPSLSAGSYISLSDETALIGSPTHNYLTMVNTGLLSEVTDPVSTENTFKEIIFSREGDTIYSITDSVSWEVKVTVWRMSSREIIANETLPGLTFLIPTKEGVVIVKKYEVAELRNFELSKVIRVLPKLRGSEFTGLFPISDDLIVCWKDHQSSVSSDRPDSTEFDGLLQQNVSSDLPDSAEGEDLVQRNVSSDLPDSAECEDSVQRNVSSDLPDSAECEDSVERNVSSDLPHSAECEDSVQRNVSSDLPDSAECEDSVQRNVSSDLPDSAECDDSVQRNVSSDLPHSAECEDSVQRNVSSDLPDSAECEDSVQRNVSSDLPDSAECEDSVERNVSSDLPHSAEGEDSVQRNVSSDLPDSAECEDSVQRNVSSDLPDSAECEDSVQRNVSSDLPDSAECEDSVQRNVSSDLPDSAECEDSVQRNVSSDLPHPAECEDSVQQNVSSDLPDSAECEDSVQRNVSSDLPESAECEDSVQQNVSSDLPDSAECEDSVERNVSSDLPDSAECEDSVQRNVSSDLPDSAECEDSVQRNVSSDLPDSAECDDSVQRNVSSDLPHSAECEDSVQRNVSSDLPDSAECEDSVERNVSSDLPHSAEGEDSVQRNVSSDLPDSAECEDSVQRNVSSDLPDSAECEDSVQRNVSSDLPDSAECEDSVQRNVSSDLPDSAECEDSVQRNVSSDLPHPAECEDSVQQNVSSDLPDSAECEDSVQRNVSSDLPESAECEDSVQQNVSSDLPDSAECEDSVERNVSSDLPDSAECEDSVQRNVSSDLPDSAECDDSVQRNVSSDLPHSAECEDSVQRNVSSDLPHPAECKDSVQRNVSSDLPDSAECEDSVQRNVSSDLPHPAECEDSVQRNVEFDLEDLAEFSRPLNGRDFPRVIAILYSVRSIDVVADILRVSSGELEPLVTTFFDHSEGIVLSVSCNSQHQLLVCSCEETDEEYYDWEKITVSLRNNGTVTSVVWRRESKWLVFNGSGCSDPHMIFSPQEEFVVTWKILDSGSGIHVLDAKTGETHHVFLKEQEDIVDCKFVDDESLVCCRKDNFLRLFNVKTGHLLSLLDIGQEPFSLGACLNHPLVAIGLKGAKLKFIQVHLPADTRKKKGES